MFRLLIMCLLGLSGVFLKTSGTQASPMDTPLMDMMSTTNDAEGMVAKSKRHNIHLGTPCPLPLPHSGTYLPPADLSGHYGISQSAYQKPIIIPSYHHAPKLESIEYQKPVVPKMIYKTIQRPATHHAFYNVQSIAKQQVQYIQQPTYVPSVNEHPISYVKPAAPEVSYENVQKLITNYVKPVQHVQPVQMIHPIKTYVKVEKPIEKPVIEMQSYYSKQFFQPISYYPKPLSQPKPISVFSPHVNKFKYPTTNVIYQKPNLVSHQQSIVKVSSVSEPACEKIHQPKISYVETPQPIIQNVHQPMFQYAPKYHQPIVQQPMVHFEQKIHQPVVQQPLFHFTQKIHQPAIVQQPIVHLPQKIHQPIAQNPVIHYTQPIVYGNAHHSVPSVAPSVNYGGHNYQSPITSLSCHK